MDHSPETSAEEEKIDIHDIEALKKLWFILRDAQKSEEVFTLTHILLDSLPYDFISKEDNWLHIAQQLESHGEAELSSLFKLANQKAFQLSLKGQ
jgi:hypothetical protein